MEKNLFPRHGKFIRAMMSAICRLSGHKWAYKNYELTWKDHGDSYDYKYSRRCQRCNDREVYKSETTGWESSTDHPDATM